jgi:hypothetical protein
MLAPSLSAVLRLVLLLVAALVLVVSLLRQRVQSGFP